MVHDERESLCAVSPSLPRNPNCPRGSSIPTCPSYDRKVPPFHLEHSSLWMFFIPQSGTKEGQNELFIHNWALFQWITKKRESGWSTFNPLKFGLKGMVEPCGIEPQTFALRMSLFWLFLNGLRAFWYAAYTYAHQCTTMHWDKCGTRN